MRLGFDLAGKIRTCWWRRATGAPGPGAGAARRRRAAGEGEAAEQGLAASEAAFAKVVAGARDMERKEARAAVDEARAVLDVARVEHERRRRLLSREVLSKEEADRAEREYKVATER